MKTQENVTDEELIIFCNHLENVVIDMGERFKNLFDVVVEDWVFNPFIDVEEVDSDHQNDLILLQNDEELKGRFKKSYQDFWLQEKLHASSVHNWAKKSHAQRACSTKNHMHATKITCTASMLLK